MKSLAILLVLVALAPVAAATTDGQPRPIKIIGSWRTHDPVAPYPADTEPWTPREVVGFLGHFPDAVMTGGPRAAYPPGNTHWRNLGALIGQARTIAKAQGMPFEGRMCISERPDVMVRFDTEGSCEPSRGGGGCDWEGDMDGEFGEAETVVKHAGRATAATDTSLTDSRGDWKNDFWRHRLLVLRPGPGEERRRIVSNTATAVSVDSAWRQPPRLGDRYEIRGSFDPAWVKRVSRSAYEETVQRLWEQQRDVCGPRGAGAPCRPAAEPLDPLSPANRRAWPLWIDRAAIEALATPTEVPALYGSVLDGVSNSDAPSAWLDPYFRISTVVMNVADPAYREWRIRYLMYMLRDHGLSAGAPACVILSYKAGWYTFYDEAELGTSPAVCATPGSNLWSGPAHVCTNGSADGGPLVSGLYERGGYEGAFNAYIRETLTRLAQSGWTDLRIITVEGAAFRNRAWSILADDVRRSSKLRGIWDGVIDPPLSLLDVAAADPIPAGDTSTAGGSSSTASDVPPTDPTPVDDTSTAGGSSSTASDVPPADPTPVDDTPTGGGSSPIPAPVADTLPADPTPIGDTPAGGGSPPGPAPVADSLPADPDPVGDTSIGGGSPAGTAPAAEAPPADPDPVGDTSTGGGSSRTTRAAPKTPANAQPDSAPTRDRLMKKAEGGGGGTVEAPSGP